MGKLSDYQKMELIEKHSTGQYNCQQLGDYYGISRMAVRQLLKRRGIARNNDRAALARKYTLNENYFERIDSEDKAYFLGLLCADGYNHESRGAVSFGLQVDDKHILEDFSRYIGSNKPIGLGENHSLNDNNKNISRLEINSKKFSEDLAKLGCFQKKSLTLKFPTENQVPKHLLRHFVRGYFDGDGCVGIYQDKKNLGKNGYKNVTCNMTSSVMFLEPVKGILEEELFVKSSIVRHKNMKTTRTLMIGGNKQTLRFLKWIYDDCSVYFNRKRNKYLEIKNYLKQTYNY